MNKIPILRSGVKPTVKTRIWHRVQERIRNPVTRRRIASVIAAFGSKRKAAARPSGSVELETRGIFSFPGFISKAEANELRGQLESLHCVDPWCTELGSFDAQSIPARTHVAQIP
jgi:hypothetical protein